MAVARGRSESLAVLSVGLFLLAGCASQVNRDKYAAIQHGMTLLEVEKIMGSSGKLLTKEELEELPSFQIKPKGRGGEVGKSKAGGDGRGGEEAPKEKNEEPTYYLWGDTKKYILVSFLKGDGSELKTFTWTRNGL